MFTVILIDNTMKMNGIIAGVCCLFLILANVSCAQSTDFYSLSAKTIDGKTLSFETLKGKKVMVVNTASECGLTPQYEQLEELYKQYKDKNFVIIGFPANNFMSQEPGTNDEIASFCKKNFGVSFQMMSKISVKGSDMDPVYEFLTSKAKNGVMDSEVKWNFQKYLIDESGKLVKVIEPRTLPNSKEVIDWIEGK